MTKWALLDELEETDFGMIPEKSPTQPTVEAAVVVVLWGLLLLPLLPLMPPISFFSTISDEGRLEVLFENKTLFTEADDADDKGEGMAGKTMQLASSSAATAGTTGLMSPSDEVDGTKTGETLIPEDGVTEALFVFSSKRADDSDEEESPTELSDDMLIWSFTTTAKLFVAAACTWCFIEPEPFLL